MAQLSKEMQEFKEKIENQISTIRKEHCMNCEEPATGSDRCDTTCEYGLRMGDLYWILRMMDEEYGTT